MRPKTGAQPNLYWLRGMTETREACRKYAAYMERYGEKPWRSAQRAEPLMDCDIPRITFQETFMDEFIFEDAVRTAAPLLISLSGDEWIRKDLLGIADGGRDRWANRQGRIHRRENGRGAMYADSKGIRAALPQGYKRAALDAPFSPSRYIAAIKAAENAGVKVLVIDSASHEWEGIGGCADIAEAKRFKKDGQDNWAAAKKEHKKFVYYVLSSPMHIIFCLRAREKVKITGDNKVVPLGIQPITEKGFIFEQMASFLLDEKTHRAEPLKLPGDLAELLPSFPRLITKADGEIIRKWNDGGTAVSDADQLRKRARAIAEDGLTNYTSFYESLTAPAKEDPVRFDA